MKVIAPLTLLLLQGAVPTASVTTADPQYFEYRRAVQTEGSGSACTVLDADVFAHASASLKDVRLYADSAGKMREVPYVITLSEPLQLDSEPARVLNLGKHGQAIVFDLAMPRRPYTLVDLSMAGRDFLATASVTGSASANDPHGTSLGQFTLFDLSGQHLGRSTSLPLAESNFPYLHVELTVSSAAGGRDQGFGPSLVQGAAVPPSREAQTLYSPATETSTITQRGRQSLATIALPQRVPVERVRFELAEDFHANFSRDVTITDRPKTEPPSLPETITGTILSVHLTQAGREIRQQQLSVPATLGSNMQGPAFVEIAVNNGDDAPLPITRVLLEMRQRKLCFNAPAAGIYQLFYGDKTLTSPEYDLSRTFSFDTGMAVAALGQEQRNPMYSQRPDERPLTERYPQLLWIALLATVCSLGVVAIHSSKKLPR